MVSGICALFNARPIYHGATKTIDIVSIYNSTGWMEIMFGRNANKIHRVSNSNSIVTRLYVEGEYGDHGYVGIDKENPTGLPFILNFDYYKQLGVFTDEHQRYVDDYVTDYREVAEQITTQTASMLRKQKELSDLIGNYGYAYYPVVNSKIDTKNAILGNGISVRDAELNPDDNIALVQSDGFYSYVKYSQASLSVAVAVLKFHPTIAGLLAAYEDIESAASNNITAYLEKLNEFLSKNKYPLVTVETLKSKYGVSDLSGVKDELFDVSKCDVQYKLATVRDYAASIGSEEKRIIDSANNKREKMLGAISLIKDVDVDTKEISVLTHSQTEIEDLFSSQMGTMLKDGYWSDENYTADQTASLYRDALEISERMAFPIASYSAGVQNLSKISKYKDEEFAIGQAVRMYDPLMKINDHGVVSKIIEHPQAPLADTVDISTDVLNIGNKTFASILERVTEMAEKVRQRKEIYNRAVAISRDGTIKSDILEGAIDVLKTKLLSSTSNWKTDDNGNIVLESLDGSSAMMLCGSGFMCANTKTSSGAWNWRTFGTGNGFTADMIIAGYLNAERIEARSITVDHLSPNVGSDLDISKNTAITLVDGKISMIVSGESTESNLVLTEKALTAIANNIELQGNESIQLMVRDAVNTSTASIKATADKIHLLIDGESDSEIVLTEEAVKVISESIELTADKINAVADQIDLRGNESIEAIVSRRKITHYTEHPPQDALVGDIWVKPSKGYTYILADVDIAIPDFYLSSNTVDIEYSYETGQTIYSFSIDENGDLCVGSGYPYVISISDDGIVTAWQRVKDSELDEAAQAALEKAQGAFDKADSNGKLIIEQASKIEELPGVIRTTVQEDIKIEREGIQKIINSNYSVVNQRADKIEIALGEKIGNDELRTYIRYEDGVVEMGASDSRYTTQTSDRGFTVLRDGEEMASMEQNTIHAPVLEAQRQFLLGNFSMKIGANGHLIVI